jgi:hypothetical protein
MNTLQGIELGRALRDQGMESVETNSGEWKHIVRGLGETWMARQSVNTTFTGEDIRMFVQSMGVPQPHHPNAWGAVIGGIIRRALKVKDIEVVGIRGSNNPTSHARRVVVYRKSV